MVHKLQQRHPLNGIGSNPLVVSLRYRCECANNEVLQISTVLDPAKITEEQFVWTVQRLWQDVQFEIEQHLRPPERAPKA